MSGYIRGAAVAAFVCALAPAADAFAQSGTRNYLTNGLWEVGGQVRLERFTGSARGSGPRLGAGRADVTVEAGYFFHRFLQVLLRAGYGYEAVDQGPRLVERQTILAATGLRAHMLRGPVSPYVGVLLGYGRASFDDIWADELHVPAELGVRFTLTSPRDGPAATIRLGAELEYRFGRLRVGPSSSAIHGFSAGFIAGFGVLL